MKRLILKKIYTNVITLSTTVFLQYCAYKDTTSLDMKSENPNFKKKETSTYSDKEENSEYINNSLLNNACIDDTYLGAEAEEQTESGKILPPSVYDLPNKSACYPSISEAKIISRFFTVLPKGYAIYEVPNILKYNILITVFNSLKDCEACVNNKEFEQYLKDITTNVQSYEFSKKDPFYKEKIEKIFSSSLSKKMEPWTEDLNYLIKALENYQNVDLKYKQSNKEKIKIEMIEKVIDITLELPIKFDPIDKEALFTKTDLYWKLITLAELSNLKSYFSEEGKKFYDTDKILDSISKIKLNDPTIYEFISTHYKRSCEDKPFFILIKEYENNLDIHLNLYKYLYSQSKI